MSKYMGKTTSIFCSKETVYSLMELLVLLVAQVNFSFPNCTGENLNPLYAKSLEERVEYL